MADNNTTRAGGESGFWGNVWNTMRGAKPAAPLVDQKPKMDVEISFANINGLMFGSNNIPITVYNPSQLVTRKGLATIDAMRRDPQVKVALNFKKHAVLSTGWVIESPKGYAEDWEVTEFLRREFRLLPGTVTRKLRNILSAMDYGYSCTEKVWTQRDDKIGLGNLKTRKPHDFMFDVDSFGNITALRQLGRMLPVNKFVVYSFVDEFENPYGTSDLEAAYTPWWLKDNGYKFLGMLLERLGIPPIFASYNGQAFTDKNAMSKLQTILANLQAGTVATIPRGESKDDITFWAPEIAGAASTVFVPALQHADTDIAKAILMPNLLGATGQDATQQGSYARAQTHFDVFMLVIESLRDELAEAIVQEQIIKPLVDLNFSIDGDDYPQFRFMPFERKDVNALMASWSTLVEKTIVSKQPGDEDFIRDLLEFPEVQDEEASAAVLTSAAPSPQGAGPQTEAMNKTNPENNTSASGNKEQNNEPGDNEKQSVANHAAKAPRKPSGAEAKIDYAQLSSDFDAIEAGTTAALRTAYGKIKARLVNYTQQNFSRLGARIVDDAELRPNNANEVTAVMRDLVNGAFAKGQEHLSSELPKKFAVKRPVSGFAPKEATDYLKRKAVTAAATANDRALAAVKQALLNALRGQKTPGEAAADVAAVFEPYIGEDPAYVNTVVRTNLIDAYNQGRLTAMRDPDVADYIAAVQYSAILDTRTTELCQFLDQQYFHTNDGALDQLTPPNHFNCRSVLVPVMIDEAPAPDEFITPAEVGKAIEMAGEFA